MTPKEKADQLLTKFINQWFAFGDYLSLAKAKQCALIAVDEMIAELAYVRTLDEQINDKIDLEIDQRQDFLIQVEKEIKLI
jgi:hypothetical protein